MVVVVFGGQDIWWDVFGCRKEVRVTPPPTTWYSGHTAVTLTVTVTHQQQPRLRSRLIQLIELPYLDASTHIPPPLTSIPQTQNRLWISIFLRVDPQIIIGDITR